jgi:hypothetical protein
MRGSDKQFADSSPPAHDGFEDKSPVIVPILDCRFFGASSSSSLGKTTHEFKSIGLAEPGSMNKVSIVFRTTSSTSRRAAFRNWSNSSPGLQGSRIIASDG